MERSWVFASLFLCESVLFSHYLSSHNSLLYATIISTIFILTFLYLSLYLYYFMRIVLSAWHYLYPFISIPVTISLLISFFLCFAQSYARMLSNFQQRLLITRTSSKCYCNVGSGLPHFLTLLSKYVCIFAYVSHNLHNLLFPCSSHFSAWCVHLCSSLYSINSSLHTSLYTSLSLLISVLFRLPLFVLPALSSYSYSPPTLCFLTLSLSLHSSFPLSLYISLNFNCQ